jgi:hypothetical protein
MTAGSSDNAAKPRGRPFKPGQSGNPAGTPKGTREIRHRVSELLDAAFRREDGSDVLIDAIKAGVETGDSTCMKLACEYRYGKPVTMVELSGPDGEPLGNKIDLTKLSNDDVERLQQIAAKAKGDEK